MKKRLTLIAVSAALAMVAGADTVSFQENRTNTLSGGVNYTGVMNTRVRAASAADADTNFSGNDVGIGSWSSAWESKGLFRFDLSSLAALAGAGESIQINSATLSLLYDSNSGSGSETVSAYAIAAANNGWTETTATWNEQNNGSSTAWAGSGGLSTAGTDYDATAIGSLVFPDAGFAGTWNRAMDLTASTVEGWVADASSNAGILLRLPSSADSFIIETTNGDTDPQWGTQPKLTIDYTVVPEPATLGLLGAGSLMALFIRRFRV